MKKLLLLFLAVSLTFSCSSNDETPVEQGDNTGGDNGDEAATSPDTDAIVGVWKLVKVNGQEVSGCENKDGYDFTNDGKYVLEDYKETNGSCEKDTSTSHNGYWQKNDDGTYNFKKHGYTGDGSDFTIIFEENNTVLTFNHNKYTFKKQ